MYFKLQVIFKNYLLVNTLFDRRGLIYPSGHICVWLSNSPLITVTIIINIVTTSHLLTDLFSSLI